jgi:hypothetical protein
MTACCPSLWKIGCTSGLDPELTVVKGCYRAAQRSHYLASKSGASRLAPSGPPSAKPSGVQVGLRPTWCLQPRRVAWYSANRRFSNAPCWKIREK